MTEIYKIYSKNGKELFPRNGMIIARGSIVNLRNDEFVQLTENHIYSRKTEWNNLCQTREENVQLIPVV
jgi:hypothetical protein